MKNTFTLWGVQDTETGELLEAFKHRVQARHCKDDFHCKSSIKVVKLSCQIVPQKKAKPKKYNFGLPAGMTPHNPDNLTPEQVGEGFRLLAKEEIWNREDLLSDIEMWMPGAERWSRGRAGCDMTRTYRVPADWPLDTNPKLKGKK